MSNIVTDSYILFYDTIQLMTEESKENVKLTETPPYETYDIVQNLYAMFQYKITGEQSMRSLKVNIAQLNKVSCEANKGKLKYTAFSAINDIAKSDIITAIQSAIEDEIDSIKIENQYKSAANKANSEYELMFPKPLIYDCFNDN